MYTMSYSQYLQSPQGTYISDFVTGTFSADSITATNITGTNLSNGEGLISSFGATGTSILNTNITAFSYDIYVLRVGQFAHCEIISGTVSCTPDEDIVFSITYPPPISRNNVNNTTGGGKVVGVFNDVLLTKNAGCGITENIGQNNITYRITSPAGCSSVVLRADFTLKLN